MSGGGRRWHHWEAGEWAARERICLRCGVRARHHGIGRDGYWGYVWPGQEGEASYDQVPACPGEQTMGRTS